MIIDADLKQIEWRVEAELTQDPVMISEIKKGVDQHSDTCTSLMELPLTKENRNDAKIFNFRAIYADPSNAAYAYWKDPRMPDFSKKKWEEILEGFFNKYYGMSQAHVRWVNEVRKTGQLTGITGRIWDFQKQMRYGGVLDYSVTQIRNYPVQGTAGDLIKLALIYIRKRIKQYNACLTMTVHDSIILDVEDKDVEVVSRICLETFQEIPDFVKKHFGYTMSVPIDGEIEIGPTWGTTKAYM